MNKKLVFLLILTSIFCLTGCDLFKGTSSPNVKPASLAMTMSIPGQLADMVVSGTVTMVKDSVTQEYPLTITGSTAKAIVSNPAPGTWTLTARLRDADNYVIYQGSQTAVIHEGGTTNVKIHLTMTPGDVTATVDLSTFTDVASGKLVFSNGNTSVEQALTIANSQGTAIFNQLEARVWNIQVQLYNASNELVKSARDSAQILPGRMNYVTIRFAKTGELIIDVTWELPPLCPKNITGSVVNNAIQLSWNANTEADVIGYRVYRSLDEVGPYVQIHDGNITTTQYTDIDTFAGHTYWYKIIAVNSKGIDSGFSAAVSVIFPLDGGIGGGGVGPGLADTASPRIGLNQQRTMRSPYLGPQRSSFKWKFHINSSGNSSPVIGPNGTIYFSSTYGNVYAINSDGTQKWVFSRSKPFYATPSIASDGTIYVGAENDKFYAINPDGTEKWSLPIASPLYQCSSPNIGQDGTIYVGGYYHIYAINPNGTIRWKYPTNIESTNCDITLGKDGILYFILGNKLFAMNPDGTLKWNYAISGGTSAPAIGDDGTIYFTTTSKYYAINPDGTLKWSLQISTNYPCAPAINSDGTTYLNAGSTVYKVSSTGTIIWSNMLGDTIFVSSPLIGSDGTVYMAFSYTYNYPSKIYALYPDGNIKWSYSTGESGISNTPFINADGTLYLATSTYVYALNDK